MQIYKTKLPGRFNVRFNPLEVELLIESLEALLEKGYHHDADDAERLLKVFKEWHQAWLNKTD